MKSFFCKFYGRYDLVYKYNLSVAYNYAEWNYKNNEQYLISQVQ
jgi:hypothetical protein